MREVRERKLQKYYKILISSSYGNLFQSMKTRNNKNIIRFTYVAPSERGHPRISNNFEFIHCEWKDQMKFKDLQMNFDAEFPVNFKIEL